MSTEDMVKAVGYLRASGGYFLTVEAIADGIVCIGSFKDVGSYSSTVSFASSGQDLEEVQAACIIGLAKLVKFTENAKPTPATKPAAAAPTGNAIVSLKGVTNENWESAKNTVKQAGFRFDKESKDWVGGDVNALPDWLKKRVKGASSNGYSKPAYSKPAYKQPEPQPEEEQPVEEFNFGDSDTLPF